MSSTRLPREFSISVKGTTTCEIGGWHECRRCNHRSLRAAYGDVLILWSVVVVCASTTFLFLRAFLHFKEMEAMRTNREIAVARVNADAEKLTLRVDALSRDVKALSTPERQAVVNELAKKMKLGLGI